MLRLAREAHARGIPVAVDPNLRPGLDGVVGVVTELLPMTTYLLLGMDEAVPLFGTDQPGGGLLAGQGGRRG